MPPSVLFSWPAVKGLVRMEIRTTKLYGHTQLAFYSQRMSLRIRLIEGLQDDLALTVILSSIFEGFHSPILLGISKVI